MDGEEDSQPDKLRAVPVIQIVDDWIKNFHDEIADSANYGYGKQPYPCMSIVYILLRTLLSDFKEKIAESEGKEKEIDIRYGGSPLEKNFEMTYQEADERAHNLMKLWRDGGPGYIDKRYDYYQMQSPDYVDFTEWGED